MKNKKVIISIGAICIIGIMVAVAFSVNKNKEIIEVSSPNIGVSEAFTEPVEETTEVEPTTAVEETKPIGETVEPVEEEPVVEETPVAETKPVIKEEPKKETPVVKEETPKQETPQEQAPVNDTSIGVEGGLLDTGNNITPNTSTTTIIPADSLE